MPHRFDKQVCVVTGSAGFVGRHVVDCLAKSGIAIRCVVRTGAAKPPLPVDTIESDDVFGESSAWWQSVCDGASSIIHLAWTARPGQYLSDPENHHCLRGTLRMAEGALNAGVNHVTGIGTCLEYAQSSRPVDTDWPLDPKTLYSATKASAYLSLSKMLPLQGCSLAWCRLFQVHGSGEHPNRLAAHLHHNLSRGLPTNLTSGRQIRDFISVETAASQIVAVTVNKRDGPANICSGTEMSVRQFAEQVADLYQARALLHFNTRPDNARDPQYLVGIPTRI